MSSWYLTVSPVIEGAVSSHTAPPCYSVWHIHFGFLVKAERSFGRREFPRRLGNLDVFKIVLSDCVECVVVCMAGQLARRHGADSWSAARPNIQIPPTIVSRPSPVTAFLTRYGRLARMRA